jgi:hypothetical protein
MKFCRVKRKSRMEPRYHPNMGRIYCEVTRIKLYLFGIIPIKTYHKYRETYYGEIKDCENCNLYK